MNEAGLEFYATPGPMTRLPETLTTAAIPTDLDEVRRAVQGLLLHRDWAALYCVTGTDIRLHEEHLRSTVEVLERAFEISAAPVTVVRDPIDRVLCICRHFTLVHTAFLRAHGVPARVRCGFSNYFDPAKWFDHWITERWDGERWVRDDPQVDDVQQTIVTLDFDPYDQPPGKFLSASEAWIAARAGEVDPNLFGIFDMWGLGFISGNVVSDMACINKVELLPWDHFGLMKGPDGVLTDADLVALDDVAALVVTDDFDAIRDRYLADDRFHVPPTVTTMIDGEPVVVHLDL